MHVLLYTAAYHGGTISPEVDEMKAAVFHGAHQPLAELPPIVGALCWFYLKVAMTLAALYWVFRIVEDPGRPFGRRLFVPRPLLQVEGYDWPRACLANSDHGRLRSLDRSRSGDILYPQ